jgi:hypothetical protein
MIEPIPTFESDMTQTTVNSKAIKPTSTLEVNDTVRDLIAAMPIVIFANAIREALRRPTASARATVRSYSR